MRVPKEWCNGKDIRRYYQHPTDCTAFVMCRRTRPPLVRQCYFDLVFDDKSQTCNYRRFTTCHLDGLGSQRNKTYTVKEGKNSNNYDKNPRLVSVYLRHRSFRKGRYILLIAMPPLWSIDISNYPSLSTKSYFL